LSSWDQLPENSGAVFQVSCIEWIGNAHHLSGKDLILETSRGVLSLTQCFFQLYPATQRTHQKGTAFQMSYSRKHEREKEFRVFQKMKSAESL
jgi:hypothetical protein